MTLNSLVRLDQQHKKAWVP